MSSTLLSAIGTAVFFTAMCVALAYGYVAVERLYQADLAAHAELARPVRRPNLDATDVDATDVGGVDLRVTCAKFMGAGFTATAFTDGPEKVPAVERFRSAGIGLIQLGDPYEDAVVHPPPVVRPRLAGRPVSPA